MSSPPVAIEMRLYNAVYVHQALVQALLTHPRKSEQYREAVRKLKAALAEQDADAD